MSNNIIITFPDGNTKSVEKGISGFDLANQISKSLAKEAVAIKIDGKICDLSLPLNNDCKVVIIKKENDEALDIIRHDCAHVMAEAVQSLYPGTQVTIGPSIENGFYYDFARKEPFTIADLPKIEKKMHEIMFKSIVTFDLKSSYFLIASLPLLPIHAGGVKIHLSSVPSLVKSF